MKGGLFERLRKVALALRLGTIGFGRPDAIADAGQITRWPVFNSAAFVGYPM